MGLFFRNRCGYPYLCGELYLVKPEGASYRINYGRCDGDKIFPARQHASYTFQRATLEYDADKYGQANREVNMSGKIYFSVRRNALSPFIATTEYAQVKVLGTEFEVDEYRKDTATRVYVKSGKVVFKGRYGKNGIVLTKDMCGMLTHGDEMPVAVHAVSPNPSAWAIGKFIYRNTPIDEVLKELSFLLWHNNCMRRNMKGQLPVNSRRTT